MFFSWKKDEPVVEFYSIIPGIDNLSPPIKARDDYPPKWIKTHAQITKNILENESSATSPNFRIERCPGIRGMTEQGISIKTWQDMKLTLSEDGKFEWHTPTKHQDLINGKYVSPEVQAHAGEQFPEFCRSRADTWPHIIKIVTNWRVSITKGWHFLMLPNYYSDHPWFTAVPGIYNPEYGRHINVNLQIHIKNGEVFFPAGTTIVKMIPVKKDQDFNLKIRKVTEEDLIHEGATLAAIKKRFWSSRKEQIKDLENIYASKCPFFKS